MLDELKTTRKVIGLKQSKRVIKDGGAVKAFVAEDAEDRVRLPVLELCREMGVGVEPVISCQALGAACDLEVGASVAVLLK